MFALVVGFLAAGVLRTLRKPRYRRDRDEHFRGAVAVSIILVASQDRPFGGPLGVKPSVLEQVTPQDPARADRPPAPTAGPATPT